MYGLRFEIVCIFIAAIIMIAEVLLNLICVAELTVKCNANIIKVHGIISYAWIVEVKTN